MKKQISILCFFLYNTIQIVSAQHIISASASSTLPVFGYFPKIKYEYGIDSNFSAGLQTNFFADETIKGTTFQVLGRYYYQTDNLQLQGNYVQFSFIAGSVTHYKLYEGKVPVDDFDLYDSFGSFGWLWLPFDLLSDNDKYLYEVKEEKVTIGGIALNIGRQKNFKKYSSLYYDVNAGIKICPAKSELADSFVQDGVEYFSTTSKDSKDGPTGYKLLNRTPVGNIFSVFAGIGYKF